MRHGCKTCCAERGSLEDGGKINSKISIFRLEDGFHTIGTSIFDGATIIRTYTMVYKLRVIGAKFQLPRCAACKCKGNDTKCGRVMPVRTLAGNNGCDKSDTDDPEQCLRYY